MNFIVVDVITCVALDTCGSYLVTGSKDFTCIVWSLQNASVKVPFATTSPSTIGGSTTYHQHSIHSQMNVNSTLFNNIPKPIHRLYGHDNELSCVAIMTELDLVVSGSKVSKEVYLTICLHCGMSINNIILFGFLGRFRQRVYD